jgi:hypothetical protein
MHTMKFIQVMNAKPIELEVNEGRSVKYIQSKMIWQMVPFRRLAI